ncbi:MULTISPECIES: DUF4194 domain-containing protein [Pseudomonas]|uniref:DUF4194 domain-containing protein n=1 Tax=Pseudomonas TaxID=286 RepID=UPI0005A900C8|nr:MULTISPECIES: DUF4194 domain-containing protein [Pseudomonas]AZD36983.1 hypothetical protein C4K22_4248 [Pseudomonas chlororaphis subsp. aurantiaca]AZD43322.1 hypothetical protein C4K21_4256 [Pseudomonas chlororaphis subsp. aurantiaca]AZD49565.1 hypothetical protein C4K20_4158 [Pseudomonas chlororaphis subsp. aurantiaca]AZD80689.1 hypothetical protein C4K15_4130 [Pseudomonas chlororaphis subsp. aurantiaca]AZD93764.1 hypothetical protein C4K13_4355 [Pseudomonas chlororaphis subsp. aureofacie
MVSWERLAEDSSENYVAEDFEKAAYRLIVSQAIYAGDHGSRLSYHLIVKYLSAFKEVLSKLGMSLRHNHHHSYLVAIPNHQVAEKMRLNETRLALVLRRFYDDRMHTAEVTDGEAYISLEELERAYREWLARDLPERADLKELVVALKRYGMVRLQDSEDGQPFKIVIRPGITDILGETALHQLAAYAIVETDTEADNETA